MSNPIPIVKKINCDSNQLLSMLSHEKEGFLLESSLDIYDLGRYSFFGISPFLTIQSKNGSLTKTYNGKNEVIPGSIFRELKTLLKRYSFDARDLKIRLPFFGGAVGYFAYDLGFSLEKIRRKNPDDLGIADAWFGFFDVIVAIDHYCGSAFAISSGFPKQNRREQRKWATYRLDCFLQRLASMNSASFNQEQSNHDSPIQSNISHAAYVDTVQQALGYITQGDIYQVNLSQRFSTESGVSAEQLYYNFKQEFPVSFGGILKTGGIEIISGSPERFLKFDGSHLFTRPMKGTRPRSDNGAEDLKLRRQLEASAKDKAELLMVVDLERNDLGRVCEYGSIKVKNLRMIEQYASVYQATAQIQGELFPKCDRVDAIKACFPGGSITGCPKIRAMEIIEALEPHRRGIYTGSMGYFSFSGTMDFNILIRSFLKKNNHIYFGVGGGIVSDSEPELEYQETLVKAKALVAALRGKVDEPLCVA